MPQTAKNPLTPGATGAEAMALLNSAIEASLSLSSGSTEPSSTVAFMFWVDTDFVGQNMAKQRNADDSGWRWLWPLDGAAAPFNGSYQEVSNDYDMATLTVGGDESASNAQHVHFAFTTGNRTLTLPAAEDREFGRVVVSRSVFDTSGYLVSVVPTSGIIQGFGASGVTLNPGDSIEFVSNGGSPVWQVGRIFGHPTVAVTATYTARMFDERVLCDATAGAFTVTLPSAASARGREIVFVKTDASGNAVTLDGASAETINGAATASLASQYAKKRLLSTGTEWVEI
jgi:hypothetical protein